MIDIGTGTGLPLKEFLKTSTAERVLAIDINESYVKTSTKRFADDKRVEVKYLNFMDVDQDFEEKFDVVYFGFSFMLMPDKPLALKKAAMLLKPGGRIFLFLTLYETKNSIVEFIKPKMKFLTSVDFGTTIYNHDVKAT